MFYRSCLADITSSQIVEFVAVATSFTASSLCTAMGRGEDNSLELTAHNCHSPLKLLTSSVSERQNRHIEHPI